MLTINAKYAARFEHNKKREEKHRLEEKVKREYFLPTGAEGEDDSDGDDSDSDDSDDGDVPGKLDAQFARALVRIKSKDPSLYEPDTELFSSDAEESSSSDDDDDDDEDDENKKKKKKKKKEKKPKRQTLREVVAGQLLEGGARAFEDDDDAAAPRRPNEKSYVEEQADLKKAFKDAADGADSDDDGGSGSDSGGGLRVKRRAGAMDSDADSDEDAKAAKGALCEYFDGKEKENDGKGGISKEDAFLRDYLLNEKWKENEDAREGTTLNFIGGGTGESSEEEVEEAEKFEQTYNFRFEEPEGAKIVSHARVIEGTVRREKTARREKRKEREARKLSEKERLKAEVRRLKNLKREEIQQKMAQIASVGGLAGADAVAAANLTAEFDPDEHDKLMRTMYDDGYYGAGEGEDGDALEKPEFGDLDDEVGELLGKGGDEGKGAAAENNSAQFEKLRAALAARKDGFEGDDIDDYDDDDDDDDGGENDEENDDDEAPNAGNKFSKRAAKRWRKELTAKMDEYYAIDAEDFIDDIPCRFKYKEVAASMYGLTTKEMLAMSDRDLNQIVSLKKLAPYRTDADAPLQAKDKHRNQRMAREFLAEAAKRRKGGKKGGKKGAKKGGDDDDGDDDDDDAAAAAAAEDRKASYGARAWGKHNLNKRKKPTGDADGGGGGGDAGGKETQKEERVVGGGKNAAKNAKKRAKKKQLEDAKAAGMV